MLTTKARSRLAVVLVGARNPQNIGAAARAMQDFGFSDLRVVNGYAPPFEAAQLEAKSAVGAGEVMRSAKRFNSLAEAISDCTLVAGTTAIGGRELRHPVVSLSEAAPQIIAELLPGFPGSPELPAFSSSEAITEPSTGDPSSSREQKKSTESATYPRAALLFGSEKTGLTKDQLSHCSLLLTIPMFAPEGRHLSMNLGQAVAVCLYELSREGFEGARALPPRHTLRAAAADRERLTAFVLEIMHQTDYARRFPANSRPEIVRRLSASLGESRQEAATWMGLFRIILRALRSEAVVERGKQKA